MLEEERMTEACLGNLNTSIQANYKLQTRAQHIEMFLFAVIKPKHNIASLFLFKNSGIATLSYG